MIEKTYKVSGMSCNHCVMHVKNAVTGLGGAESCDVNLEKGSITVLYDETKVGYNDIKEAVKEAGYDME